MTAIGFLHELSCDWPDRCTCTPHRVAIEGDVDMTLPAVHWTCPDCGLPCACTAPFTRVAIHRRCGVRP